MRLMSRRRRQRPQGRHSRNRDKALGNRFDRVAESEFGVDGGAHNWQQVHQPSDRGGERRAEIGILPSQFFQPCLFIERIDEDRSIEGREGLYQRFRESAPWAVATVCKEFPVMRHAIAIDCVQ
jgi:hypothetical protein